MDNITALYEPILAANETNNAWSAEQAQKAMDWQERMSNTAHQREVKDLIAAGLNPVLSAGGTGATTGTGHAAQAGGQNVTALYGLFSKVLDAQIKQAEAMQTTAEHLSYDTSGHGLGSGSRSGNGSSPFFGNSLSPAEIKSMDDEIYRRDKINYGTKVAELLKETRDPWKREQILSENGYGQDDSVKDFIGNALGTAVRYLTAGAVDQKTAKAIFYAATDYLDKPIDKLAGWIDKTFFQDHDKKREEKMRPENYVVPVNKFGQTKGGKTRYSSGGSAGNRIQNTSRHIL